MSVCLAWALVMFMFIPEQNDAVQVNETMRLDENCSNETFTILKANCTRGCNASYYGLSCNQTCPKNCLDGECFQTSGVCKRGCKSTFYGHSCDFTCNEKCVDSICDFETGQCTKGCKETLSGINCEGACSQNCQSRICDWLTGECLKGCEEPYVGRRCETRASENGFPLVSPSTCLLYVSVCLHVYARLMMSITESKQQIYPQ